MAETAAGRRSAFDALGLAAAPAPGAAITLAPLADGGRLNLRLDPALAEAAAGWSLPTAAGTVWQGEGGRRALWLGPDEWLLLCPLAEVGEASAALAAALAGHHHALVDLTDNYASLSLAGRPAADVLAKGCPLDLDRFAVGRVAQSLIGKVDAIIERRPDSPGGGLVFEITVRRSFAHYTWEWLADGAREFGLAVEA